MRPDPDLGLGRVTTVDLRVALPAGLAWIVTAVAIGVPELAVGAMALLWVAAGALALIRPRIALIAIAAALCCTSVAVQSPGRHPDAFQDASRSGRSVQIVATATETVLPGTTSFAATVISANGLEMSVPSAVFGGFPAGRIPIGASIGFTATAASTQPGDRRAVLLFPDGPIDVLDPPAGYLGWADGLRSSFGAAASELPGEGGDLLAGLAIGDTSTVSETLDAAMKTSSLSHLTAVSGANCAIVIGLVMLAGGALRMPRAGRIAAASACLVAFVVLVTPQPSVMRAAVMAALVLAALLAGRPARGLPVLGLATIGLLVGDPWLARDYGFALSVLATAGLLVLAGPLAARLERVLPRWLALTIAVPVAAQLACQPVILLLSPSLPTYGVVANLLAAPAAPIATVVGLAACVALLVAHPLGVALCWVAWLPSAWIAGVAGFFANAPGARLPWPGGAVGVGLLVLVTGLGLTAILAGGRLRRVSAAVTAVGVVMYLGLAVGGAVASRIDRPPDWQIAVCDIGQGDAVFVRSEGRIALIDTGPKPARMTRCLTELGIRHIDLLVLTHYDLDHVGGTDAVLGLVDNAFVGPPGDSGDVRLREDLAASGATVQQVARGPTGILGDLRWSLLWPPSRLGSIEPGNPASVTVRFDPVGACPRGCLSSIFLGDLGEEAQNRMLAVNRVDRVDVVKVAHHGSRDQSPRLYEQLAATVGVIGVGVDNGYGHPTDRLLGILTATGTAAFRTDLGGLILCAPGEQPGSVAVWTEK